MALATRPSGLGLPMTTSSMSRSVRSLAAASSRGTSPFIGTSDDDVTMIRPGTGSTSAWGRKTVWSTPTGTTVIRWMSTPIWSAMSTFDDSDTVTTRGRARATLTCIRRKPNQRRWVNCCQGLVAWLSASWRSTVIGWCSVVSSGQPSSIIPRMPLPRHWLSWTRSNSWRRPARRRRARRLNVQGSGKPAVHITPNSNAAIGVV